MVNWASKMAFRTCSLAISFVRASNLDNLIEIIRAKISSSSSSLVVPHWPRPGRKESPREVAAATAAFLVDNGVSPSVNDTLFLFVGGGPAIPLCDADDVADGDGVTAIGIGRGGDVMAIPSDLSWAAGPFEEELDAVEAELESTSVEDLEELFSCVRISSFSMNDMAASIGETWPGALPDSVFTEWSEDGLESVSSVCRSFKCA